MGRACCEQAAELERTADAMVELESRADAAEAQRDAALDAARALTPRPPLPPAMPLPRALGPRRHRHVCRRRHPAQVGAAQAPSLMLAFLRQRCRVCMSQSCKLPRGLFLLCDNRLSLAHCSLTRVSSHCQCQGCGTCMAAM